MYLIEDAHIVNEGRIYKGALLIKGDVIDSVYRDSVPASLREKATVIDGSDCWLMPGVIDDHVHFRDPGFPEKADFHSESRAAVAGGVTSVLDMPNTNPPTISVQAWEEKMQMIATKSLVNYSCYLGASNVNADELLQADYAKICGIKLFMGSSTGNLLVDREEAIEKLFKESPVLIAVHAEDNAIIAQNLEHYKKLYGDAIPVEAHALIRSKEACFQSTYKAVELARKYKTRLHVLHVSTAKELALMDDKPLAEKHITCETCPQYLYFNDKDYEILGSRIKCNPSIKMEEDQLALHRALMTDRIDVIGTDHAPHLLSQKQGTYTQMVSGMPGIQFSLTALLDLAKQGKTTVEDVVKKMCHNPAKLFGIEKRGFIRKGYKADLVLVRRKENWVVKDEDVISKCAWTPFVNRTFTNKVVATFVNGQLVYNDGAIQDDFRGEALSFAR